MLLLMRSDHITNENLWGEEEKKKGEKGRIHEKAACLLCSSQKNKKLCLSAWR